jgi:hypothetical protein
MSIASLQLKPVIESQEGYITYLLIVDGHTHKVWVYPIKMKEHPIETVDLFLQQFGLRDGTQRYIHTDQGGELAKSTAFCNIVAKHGYAIKSTGPNVSSQNGRRDTALLPTMVWCMLYGASLSAEFWADALVYAAYLYNRTHHTAISKTPFEASNGTQPNLSHIRKFRSSVTVKKPGRHPTKGDPHCYHGIFLRYTAMRKN